MSLSGPSCPDAVADFHDSYNVQNAKYSDGVGLHYIALERTHSGLSGVYRIRSDDTMGTGLFEIICPNGDRNLVADFTVTR